jgi:hypothetical protein
MVEWRIGQSGETRDGKPWAKVLAYLTARAVQDRLDEVFGVFGWSVEYREWQAKDGHQAQICRITVNVGNDSDRPFDRMIIYKEDGAESTDIESVKGGLSSAFKRAAVALGIGRYLYDLGDTWAECSTEKREGFNYAKYQDNNKAWKTMFWKPPTLPEWALPQQAAQRAPERTQPEQPPKAPQIPPKRIPPTPEPPAAAPPAPPQEPARPACVPHWWKTPGITEPAFGNPKVKPYYSRIDNWRDVDCHRRFIVKEDRLVDMPTITLGEMSPKVLPHWIEGFYVNDLDDEKDLILRAALDLAREESLQQGPGPSSDIPF